ncbi:hypothetical protein GOODEAATRI_010261 [Goodea atripinnis]|uniref:Uncharacterized protein n=1 Tax=Goodea atripinnis TaxID=208336 RepID=A0ABV0N062_9TELE
MMSACIGRWCSRWAFLSAVFPFQLCEKCPANFLQSLTAQKMRPQAEDLSREAKPSTEVSNNPSTAIVTQSSHNAGKTICQAVTSPSPATSNNSVLSNFLYGMPMSSKPHPDSKLDFKPAPLLNLGKDRLANWTDKGSSGKDSANTG